MFGATNTAELYDKLIREERSHQQPAIIEAFLRSVLQAGKLPNDGFQQTLALVSNNYQQSSVYEFCTKNRLYYKKLERQFLQYAGYTPKEFFNIRRFYNAVGLIYQSKRSLTDICHSLGFYDQSHFIKDFKNYTSLPPLKFIKEGYQVPRWVTTSAFV